MNYPSDGELTKLGHFQSKKANSLLTGLNLHSQYDITILICRLENLKIVFSRTMRFHGSQERLVIIYMIGFKSLILYLFSTYPFFWISFYCIR